MFYIFILYFGFNNIDDVYMNGDYSIPTIIYKINYSSHYNYHKINNLNL